ncbi:hypothetical protein Tco_0570158 [Tanacetum coccineum]
MTHSIHVSNSASVGQKESWLVGPAVDQTGSLVELWDREKYWPDQALKETKDWANHGRLLGLLRSSMALVQVTLSGAIYGCELFTVAREYLEERDEVMIGKRQAFPKTKSLRPKLRTSSRVLGYRKKLRIEAQLPPLPPSIKQ